MNILVDTRNKHSCHPQDAQLEAAGCQLVRQALPVGDYAVLTSRFSAMETIRRHERYIKIKYKDAPLNSEIKMNVLDLVGTYSIAVDTKQSITELDLNLLNTSSRYRFERELLRSQNAGIHLTVLVGDDDYCNGIEALEHYYGPKRDNPIAGKAMIEKMEYYHRTYGTEFLFCAKNALADNIINILKREPIQ